MKFLFTTLFAKFIYWTIKIFNTGAGYTLPGYLALKINAHVLKDPHIKFNKGVVFITGTNGKTTTAKLIAHMLEKTGHSVLTNNTGANLLGGITSSILLATSLRGHLVADYGVFEVDEFTLPNLLPYLCPNVLVLLNLSRDQLDRYGETDIIAEKWGYSIVRDTPGNIVAYSGTPDFIDMLSNFSNVHYFDDSKDYLLKTKLKGDFNANNLNAALYTLRLFGFAEDFLLPTLATFEFAYGRGERIANQHIYLAKNPSSFNHNLSLLADFNPINTAVFLLLNDNIPDGRDVSWIYDIDSDALSKSLKPFKHIFISGTRCYDLAVRLHYVGITLPLENISVNISEIVAKMSALDNIRQVVTFPNYSAMLALRKLLLGRSIL